MEWRRWFLLGCFVVEEDSDDEGFCENFVNEEQARTGCMWREENGFGCFGWEEKKQSSQNSGCQMKERAECLLLN